MSEDIRRKPRGRKPIVQHPLFPATVALWFGALFGLGSIAVRPALIERAVLAAHIDSLLPAAAPPLGMTARILLALAMAATGALIGAIVARRIARPAGSRRAAADERAEAVAEAMADAMQPEAPARARRSFSLRPLSVADDIDSPAPQDAADIIQDAAAPAPSGRRRSLPAIDSLDIPQTDPAAELPAPLDIAGIALPDHAAAAHAAAAIAPGATVPLDLDMLGLEPLAPHSEVEAPVETAADVNHLDYPATAAAPDDAIDDNAVAAAEPAPAPAPAPAPEPQPAPADIPLFAMPVGNAAERILSANLEHLSNVELVERLAIALQRRRERDEAASAAILSDAIAVQASVDAAPADVGGAMLARLGEPERPAPPSFRPVTLTPAQPASAQPAPAQPAPAQPATLAPADRPLAPAESAALPVTAPSPVMPPPPAAIDTPAFLMPAALRPIALAPEDDADADLPAFVPPRSFSLPDGPPARRNAADNIHAFSPAALTPATLPGADARDDYLAEDDAFTDPDEALVEDAEADDEDGDSRRPGGFSSLLRVGRPPTPRADLIRLDDAHPAFLAMERAPDTGTRDAVIGDGGPVLTGPVIAFPGQAASLRSADAEASGNPAPLRRFDPPSSGDDSDYPANPAETPRDPEETERALRAALATLQRMSGAA